MLIKFFKKDKNKPKQTSPAEKFLFIPPQAFDNNKISIPRAIKEPLHFLQKTQFFKKNIKYDHKKPTFQNSYWKSTLL